ncbi:MAG: sodium:proton antiporter [Candidatus Rokuibacteriota bacterium]|nr:MAG: sodium:proton antiporter [Candidatus Rokubacteria bacterium]
MVDLHFTNLLIVVAAGFVSPLVLGLFPRLLLPSVVFELVLGIILGPSVLGWVHVDDPVRVMSLVGLATLLFLSGLEIDFMKLRGKTLQVALIGFVVSFAIAIAIGLGFKAAGLVSQPLFIAIVLSATSLGVVVAVLKDAGQVGSTLGQLVIAGATIADFATVILLSIFFSRESSGTAAKFILLGSLFVAAVLVGLVIAGVEHSRKIRATLLRLQDTTAQIRVRGAFVLMIGLVALASQLGLEVILGAFTAGVILTLVDRDEMMTHPEFRTKLEAVGFGVFIPVFFVTSGVTYNLDALTSSGSTILRVPLFLAALFCVRGLPALLLYRRLVPRGRVAVSALLQATSLPFIIAATAIGLDLHLITAANGAAVIAAGLLSVLLFPAGALTLLKRDPKMRAEMSETARGRPVVVPSM